MIVRRYGNTVQSVQPNFDSRAMTEIGFLRTGALSLTADAFLEEYERVGEQQLTAAAEGSVKDETEQQLLASLRAQLTQLEEELGQRHLLVVESEPGRDYPKTRDRTTTLVVGGENRLHFQWTVDPPLKLGVWRRKGTA